jgi:hypothetical protein
LEICQKKIALSSNEEEGVDEIIGGATVARGQHQYMVTFNSFLIMAQYRRLIYIFLKMFKAFLKSYYASLLTKWKSV